MSSRVGLWIACAVALALAAALLWSSGGGERRSEGGVATRAGGAQQSATPAPAPLASGGGAGAPETLAGSGEPVAEELESVGEPAAMPGAISMRVEAKLAREPLSSVPHQVIGAWDEAPGTSQPGAHRSFVVIVDPSIDDASLGVLLRDIRQRNSDAEVLDVRVYDSARAATASARLDGGTQRRAHLVARVTRNDRLHYEAAEVRGTALN